MHKEDIIACAIASVAILGMVAAPFGYIYHKKAVNMAKMDSAITQVEESPSHVFNSAAHCVQYGYTMEACQKSMENAIKIGMATGNALPTYKTEAACKAVHDDCDEVLMSRPRMIGKYYAGRSYSIAYMAHLEGWQAKQGEIDVAVPLYSTKTPDIAVRHDGQTFNMNLRAKTLG